MAKHLEIILYQEDGYNNDSILEVIKQHKMIKLYAFILHDKDTDDNGELVKPHYHVYLNFDTGNATEESVAKWFGTDKHTVQRIKTSRELVLKYYLHWGKTGKHQYSIDEMVCNFDLESYLAKKAAKNSLDDTLEKCGNGTITPYNLAKNIDSITYAKHEPKIERAMKYYDQQNLLSGNDRASCTNYWVWGESGAGKTTICHMFCENQNLSVYQTTPGNDPFSKYARQQAVIVDDLRPSKPFMFDELLRLLDPNYSRTVHSRYHDKVLYCSSMFVTSIMSPVSFIHDFFLPEQESPIQLYRRIAEVWHVKKDVITISEYDVNSKKFVEKACVDNPVPDYIAAHKSNDSKIDSVSVIRALKPPAADIKPADP